MLTYCRRVRLCMACATRGRSQPAIHRHLVWSFSLLMTTQAITRIHVQSCMLRTYPCAELSVSPLEQLWKLRWNNSRSSILVKCTKTCLMTSCAGRWVKNSHWHHLDFRKSAIFVGNGFAFHFFTIDGVAGTCSPQTKESAHVAE